MGVCLFKESEKQDSPAHSPLVPQDGADHQQCQQQQQEHWDDDGGGICKKSNINVSKRDQSACFSDKTMNCVTYFHPK